MIKKHKNGHDVIKLDGHDFILEEPSREVIREALFYVYYASTTGPVMEIEWVRDYPQFGPRNEGWSKDSPHRVWHDLPEEVGEWRLEILTAEPEGFAPFFTDIRVRRDRWHWMTDITEGNKLMVRPAVKAVIEELDKEMNYFFPMKVFDRDMGELISDEYHYWIPRRRLWFEPEVFKRSDRVVDMPFVGPFARIDTAWELTHNQALRAMAAEYPFWGLSASLTDVAFSNPVFHRLKSEGITGLVENTATGHWDRNYFQNIGHFGDLIAAEK
ncbi:hypothetical protein [Falsiruegeria mediterranea]|uniref:Uncharacterized protein n=1 Tax=Falsiruegeria mediterranea M17 TaxID=1200281 RepID=A0A2R8CF91_9RHOB|nr:hypothetical protein [Falsiruegeria mediterranea]SPJ31091.1 hypothetical protein TRM7615_04631 [Falsiruegeria mediterranea M17]